MTRIKYNDRQGHSDRQPNYHTVSAHDRPISAGRNHVHQGTSPIHYGRKKQIDSQRLLQFLKNPQTDPTVQLGTVRRIDGVTALGKAGQCDE